jgi:hypothetical protein
MIHHSEGPRHLLLHVYLHRESQLYFQSQLRLQSELGWMGRMKMAPCNVECMVCIRIRESQDNANVYANRYGGLYIYGPYAFEGDQ